ncbi:MAG: DUF86 domain-containing protein [Syntrophomonadaceae bacterium]|jgi:uncharacterized protein YutE (UPF0331/DUF86 family)|nr:DUF86 domain-containing protein [Bacillota bacterium]
MVDKDIILNKSQTIERCLKRVTEEYENNPDNLNIILKQDAIILNIQRACEAAISIAMHIVAEEGLGLPQYSREAFELLANHKIIDEKLSKKLQAMVGFRNIAIHDYQKLDLSILKNIIEHNLINLKDFTNILLSRYA